MCPPMPGKRLFARRTIATAFQRISRRMRRSSCLVAREVRLLLRADRVDVARLGEARHADLALAGALEQLEHQEPGAVLARLVQDLVERLEPLAGLGLVDVGQLLLEVVDVHRGSVGARATVRRGRLKGSPDAAGVPPRRCRGGAAGEPGGGGAASTGPVAPEHRHGSCLAPEHRGGRAAGRPIRRPRTMFGPSREPGARRIRSRRAIRSPRRTRRRPPATDGPAGGPEPGGPLGEPGGPAAKSPAARSPAARWANPAGPQPRARRPGARRPARRTRRARSQEPGGPEPGGPLGGPGGPAARARRPGASQHDEPARAGEHALAGSIPTPRACRAAAMRGSSSRCRARAPRLAGVSATMTISTPPRRPAT